MSHMGRMALWISFIERLKTMMLLWIQMAMQISNTLEEKKN